MNVNFELKYVKIKHFKYQKKVVVEYKNLKLEFKKRGDDTEVYGV